MKILVLLLLSGCSPYVGYTHLSDPSESNDGYDLVCGGVQIEEGLRFDMAVCENVSPNRGTFVKADIRYVW